MSTKSRTKKISRRKVNRATNHRFITLLKKDSPCPCGNSNLQCLTFHHIDPRQKTKRISRLASEGVCLSYLMAEILKCQVLCLDCHRRIHELGAA